MAVEERLARLEERIRAIEERLSKIEKALYGNADPNSITERLVKLESDVKFIKKVILVPTLMIAVNIVLLVLKLLVP